MYESMKRVFARYGKPVADQRPFERALLADADAAVVQVSTAAARGGEQLLAHGVVDHRMLEPPALLTRDRYRKVGKPCRKFVVPSSGSMIHTVSLSPDAPLSSARKAWLGVVLADDAR